MAAKIETINPSELDHSSFANGIRRNVIDFKIVNYSHAKLLFGSQKTKQLILHNLQYLPCLLLPFLAYYLNNWWLLVGVLVSLFAGAYANTGVPFMLGVIVYCIVFWIIRGFHFDQAPTIIFFCSWFSFAFAVNDRNYQRKTARKNVLYLKDYYDFLVENNHIDIFFLDDKKENK